MAPRSPAPRLRDILEAVGHIRSVMAGVTPPEFEADWQKRWLVERGLQIISEASRRLGADLKARHPQIPWPDIAGIGNILRHEYERVDPGILWRIIEDDLAPLESACREELARASLQDGRGSPRPR